MCAWGEITHPFPNFNGAAIEVWGWISNFIPYLNGVWLLIHPGIKVNPCYQKGPFSDISIIKQNISVQFLIRKCRMHDDD